MEMSELQRLGFQVVSLHIDCSFLSCAYKLRVLDGLGSHFINIVVHSFEVLRFRFIQH
jgi:hypothetical protein